MTTYVRSPSLPQTVRRFHSLPLNPSDYLAVRFLHHSGNRKDGESSGLTVNKKKASRPGQTRRASTKNHEKPPTEIPINLKMKSDPVIASGPGRPKASRILPKKSTSTSQVNEKAVSAKLEAAKRKLHEGYQQAENGDHHRFLTSR